MANDKPKPLSESQVLNELENITQEDSTKGERHFARQFKSVYEIVRKSLVAIRKGRSTMGSERAVELTREVLEKALENLN